MSSTYEIRRAIDEFIGDPGHSHDEVRTGLAEVANYADQHAAVLDEAITLPSHADNVEYQA